MYEGFGLILLEALACEIPIISFNCETAPKEILKNRQYSILVKGGDINALAEKMILLATDKELRKKYTRNLRERALEFDINKIKN